MSLTAMMHESHLELTDSLGRLDDDIRDIIRGAPTPAPARESERFRKEGKKLSEQHARARELVQKLEEYEEEGAWDSLLEDAEQAMEGLKADVEKARERLQKAT